MFSGHEAIESTVFHTIREFKACLFDFQVNDTLPVTLTDTSTKPAAEQLLLSLPVCHYLHSRLEEI